MIKKIIDVFNDILNDSADVASRFNKNRFLIQLDMVRCLIKYKASPNNYKYFDFCNLSDSQKNTYVTYGVSQQMIKKLNDTKDIVYYEDKIEFANHFREFYKRGFICTSGLKYDEFLKFIQDKSQFICKPIDGSQGAGITVFHINDNCKEIYNEIKEKYSENYILEEWIEQHEVLSNIYPKAVNCLRIITVFDGEAVHLLTGGVTFALETEIANGSQPSIIAPVDMKSGIINKPASTFFSKVYDKHPTTNEQILGVQLPYWDEIISMLDKAAKKVPNVKYVGWDIAITPDGPIIIEGNTTPGYKYYQIPVHCENGIGNKEKYIKYIK